MCGGRVASTHSVRARPSLRTVRGGRATSTHSEWGQSRLESNPESILIHGYSKIELTIIMQRNSHHYRVLIMMCFSE